MSLQPKHLIIALSFVLGMVASSFGQNTVVKNPFVKKSTESVFKTVKVSRESGKVLNTQLNWPRSKEERKPIANTVSPLEGFQYFVPESADLLVVLRPQQRVRSELFSLLDSSSGMGAAAADWPFDSEEVEWMVAATSQKAVFQMQRSAQENIFNAIRAQLDGELEGQQPKKQRSLANDLNEDTSCLVRFTEPTGMEKFEKLLDFKGDDCGEYKQEKWLGRETFDCGCDDCCIVVRLDDRTFLIGNKQHLGAAFQSQQPTSPMIANWTRELAKSNFRGEVFVGVDLSKTDWDAFPFPEADERLGLVKAIKSVKFAVDLKTKNLFDCKAGCEDSEAASKIEKVFEEGLAMYVDAAEQWTSMMSAEQVGGGKNLQTKNMIVEFARSIQVGQQDNDLTITVPRPDGLVDMLETMFAEQAKLQQEFADFETAQSKIEMKPVLVWQNKVKRGAKVEPADVKLEQWPAELVPEGAFGDESEVVGRNVKMGSNRGMPISDSDFVPVAE